MPDYYNPNYCHTDDFSSKLCPFCDILAHQKEIDALRKKNKELSSQAKFLKDQVRRTVEGQRSSGWRESSCWRSNMFHPGSLSSIAKVNGYTELFFTKFMQLLNEISKKIPKIDPLNDKLLLSWPYMSEALGVL